MNKLKKTKRIDNTDDEKINKTTQIIGNSIGFMHDLCCTSCGTGIVLKAADAEAERQRDRDAKITTAFTGPLRIRMAGRQGGGGRMF